MTNEVPPEIRKAINELCRLQFWCGAWKEESVTDYEKFAEQAAEARQVLDRLLIERLSRGDTSND